MQGNIQDWPELDERNPEFQFLTEAETAAVIFLSNLFSSALLILINFSFY
jgi:hypothetical protein